MQIGIVGLGKMGAGIARRLQSGGHTVFGFDPKPDIAGEPSIAGIKAVESLSDLASQLKPPQVIWLMVPAGAAVDDCIAELNPLLGPGATVIDGGNSNYKDTIRRHNTLASSNTSFIDIGTSGGVRGTAEGYCLMVGGEPDAVKHIQPILEVLAPGVDRGWSHLGPTGAGHYVKMIHNGIEYGMMQAYAEGFALLKNRTEFNFDLANIAGIWNSGSVVRSWLLELAANALRNDPNLEQSKSEVDDSGEGRWAIAEAVDLDVAAPVITLSLIARLQSRDPSAFSNRLLSALRREFGGHSANSKED